MSFLLPLFVCVLTLGSCERCSEVLFERLRREIDLSERCGDCKVVRPVGVSVGSGWVGFCEGKRFLLLEDWECGEGGLLGSGAFVVVSEGSCEHFEGRGAVGAECWRRFVAEVCGGKSELRSLMNDSKEEESDGEGFLNLVDANSGLEIEGIPVAFLRDEATTSKSLFKRTLSTSTAPPRTAEKSVISTGTSTEESAPTRRRRETFTAESISRKTSAEKSTTRTTAKSTTENTEKSTTDTTKSTSTETTTQKSTTESTSTEESTTETSTEESTTEPTEKSSTDTTESSTMETTTQKSTTETSTEEPTTETSTEESTTETTEKSSTDTTESSTMETTTQKSTTEVSTEEGLTETTEKTTITTEETTTKTSTTGTTATIASSSSPSTKSTGPPDNIISSTKCLLPHPRKTCEQNEFFYKNYCYFIKYYDELHKSSKNNSEAPFGRSAAGDRMIDSVKSCQDRHPEALGLAVETEEENHHVMENLKTIHFYGNKVIFTSGVRVNDSWSEWVGWDQPFNLSVLNIKEKSPSKLSYTFYCINSCEAFWYLYSPEAARMNDSTFLIICKRPYNPRNVQVELHERCLELYRKSSCYNLGKHKSFCCAKDGQGELWFACPNETEVKRSKRVECKWSCRNDGFFSRQQPTCTGSVHCSASYNHVRYVAPTQRYALSSCPNSSPGYSTWYCASNRTFLGAPDYSLCCDHSLPKCKDLDPFLNTWMGCPNHRITKRAACPPGSVKSEALVEWYCQRNGSFLGSAPDYSKCNESSLFCAKKDRFGREWMGLPGSTAKKECPPSFSGNCFWKCKSSGTFDGSEPDCSRCKARWMDEIADKIKNHSQYDEVMEIMENYTQKEDLRMGFRHVINLTADCVALYKEQTTQNEFCVFEKFLRSFSKILKSLAGDSNVWSSFSEPDRGEYVERILQTTQNAAFANLEKKTAPTEQYNATLTTSDVEGFDFFVAYNPLKDSDFPLLNASQSDWHLRIKSMNESVESFAAMGLIMNSSLGSLMFPRGNETKDLEMNAPAVTFTVAAAADGEVVIDPNVTVVISFKHASSTRFPAAEVIRRRLHAGESPSGVFNSTLCFYYRDSDWNTEGCSVVYTSKDRTNCTCNHLSTIGLLMSIHKYEPDWVLELTSTVSSGITIVSLVLALLVFFFVDKGNNDRVLIGKNLCFCLLIGHVMLFSVMDKKFFNTSDALCRLYAILLHYVFMAAFAWMFVEGCHLYRMLVLVFDSDVDYRWIYSLIGYGVPLVIVGATELAGFVWQEQPYGQDELCWLKTPNYIWAFIGPVTVVTSVNLFILIVAMKLAISSKRRTEQSNFGSVKLWVKGWISLSTLLGVTWLFGLGYICYNETFAFAFAVLNGLQGFFIFLFRCVLCEQYKSVFLRKVKSWFLNSKAKAFWKSENVKSETKVFAVSATKSSSDGAESKDSGYYTVNESSKHGQRKTLERLFRTKPKGQKAKEDSGGLSVDINVTLTPAMSEAYLRNRMIAKNFSARKSKATWLADPENFPELSRHSASRHCARRPEGNSASLVSAETKKLQLF